MFLSPDHAQSIVNELKKAVRQDINFMDSTGRILASTNPVRIGTVHEGAVQILREKLPSLIIRENDPSRGVQKGINLPIVAEQEIVGVIGITGEPEEVSVFGDIIKRMTEVMMANRAYQEQANLVERARSLFLENWLFAQSPDWDELERQGHFLGFDLHTPHTIVLLNVAAHDKSLPEEQILQTLRSGLRQNDGSFCVFLRNRFTLFFRDAERANIQSRVGNLCRDIENYYDISVHAGISSSSNGPADLRRCYREAQTAVSAASHTGSRQVVSYDETSLEFLIRSIPTPLRDDLRRAVFAGCSAAETEEFDRIISLYFEQAGDIRACAERLYIHRNTFQYRMDQLKKKTGYDLRHPREAMILLLASVCS